ncbi:MAG: type I restriction enzyme HsdR N-terminal domain-containing protein [Bacteroidota bacterium]|nr:type I restriction enzyme HsdR N-terminal domain-containing protein [Bacteroidota bacterium]MDX5429844.1 type I restriction enzyme HsdR N-terminal domain-containing protein [Bacteroidota bacterium]MDX5468623.1 type I restriction enzyme HsdR N-terminal domain-containing protein [Bacteroidota bacterium]
MYPKLNFPEFSFKLQEGPRKKMIFDVVRKKFIVLTPEEWVRQHVVHFLIQEKNYPPALLAVESAIQFQGMMRRCDLIAYAGNYPYLLVECKAPHVALSKEVVAQIARYQSVLKVPALLITNGLNHVVLLRDEAGVLQVSGNIPAYPEAR